jgi:hypothetical protein
MHYLDGGVRRRPWMSAMSIAVPSLWRWIFFHRQGAKDAMKTKKSFLLCVLGAFAVR